ncbi:MAG: glycosyltransferase family 9 protein [Thermodesulfobacteriota bacterium]
MDRRVEPKSVIFIRRDNIGDLVCTTPAIRAVRLKCPESRIGVLVNSYNADVIRGNPDIDEIYVYEKEKHSGDKGRLRVFSENVALMRKVRRAGFDAAIGCSYGFSPRLARFVFLTGAKTRIGFVPDKAAHSRFSYDIGIEEPKETIHEVEAMMRLVEPFGVTGPPPPPAIVPDEREVDKVKRTLMEKGDEGGGAGVVAIHISSRKPRNRWPAESFARLADLIEKEFSARVLLLWSPGDKKNPLHPGDDKEAEDVAMAMRRKPLMYRTERLCELIAALSLAAVVVCSDGGAMHIAAGLARPLLTVWGSTNPRRWAPWGVDHIILKKETGRASDVSAAEAFVAFRELYGRHFDG